jgi:hypothetical protein
MKEMKEISCANILLDGLTLTESFQFHFWDFGNWDLGF